jgi:hypothetical protein
MCTHVLFSTVPDGYIGIVSSSMFAGMMFGAVGWGTCESNFSVQRCPLIVLGGRLRSFGTQHCLQRNFIFYCSLWTIGFAREFVLFPLCAPLSLGDCCGRKGIFSSLCSVH